MLRLHNEFNKQNQQNNPSAGDDCRQTSEITATASRVGIIIDCLAIRTWSRERNKGILGRGYKIEKSNIQTIFSWCLIHWQPVSDRSITLIHLDRYLHWGRVLSWQYGWNVAVDLREMEGGDLERCHPREIIQVTHSMMWTTKSRVCLCSLIILIQQAVVSVECTLS